jgi:hypothetical protein
MSASVSRANCQVRSPDVEGTLNFRVAEMGATSTVGESLHLCRFSTGTGDRSPSHQTPR